MKKYSKKKLEVLLNKTNNRCGYCGKPLDDSWQIEHMLPRCRGGTAHTDNLIPSCVLCNYKKARRNVDEFRRHISDQVIEPIQSAINQLVWADSMWINKATATSLLDDLRLALVKASILAVSFHMDGE